jgi:ABC-type branched-subunit amino acid transport system permease subunit
MINPYWELVILLCLINVIFTLTLNLIVGYNGQFSLGHAGFIAIGAYASGVVTTALHGPLWLGLLSATLFAGLAAVLIGYPCLRLRGDYLAIATLGFAEIIRIVLLALPEKTFGGPVGMKSVPAFRSYLDFPAYLNGPGNLAMTTLLAAAFLTLCAWAAWALASCIARRLLRGRQAPWLHWALLALITAPLAWHYQAAWTWFLSVFQFDASFSRASTLREQWALFLGFILAVAAVTWLLRNYLRSVHGRAAVAIREDEIAAANLGIDCTFIKLQNFVLGCAIAGFGGAMYAHTMALFKPADFNLFKSVDVLLMVVLGGMGSLPGSFVGAVSITFLLEALRAISRFRMVIYSLLLILLMLFRPSGIMGAFVLPRLKQRKKAAPAPPPVQPAGGANA